MPWYRDVSSPWSKGSPLPRKYSSACWTQKSTIPSNNARLLGKWLYRELSRIPTARAMSRTDAPSYPCRENSSRAVSRIFSFVVMALSFVY